MSIPKIKIEKKREQLIDKDHGRVKSADTLDSMKNEGQTEPYENWTRSALYLQAKQIEIPGRSKMDKTELIHALRNN